MKNALHIRLALSATVCIFFGAFTVLCMNRDLSLPQDIYADQLDSFAHVPAAKPLYFLPQPPAQSLSLSPDLETQPEAPSQTPAAPGIAAQSSQAGPDALMAQRPSSPTTTLSWNPLMERLVEDGFDKDIVDSAFRSLKCPPLPEFMGQKAIELYGRHGKASLLGSEAQKLNFSPPNYSRLSGGMSIAAGRRVMASNAKFFEGLYKRYGVPAPFIVAILMVETGLGAETGRQSALLALGSMSVTNSLDHVLPVVNGINTNHEELNERIKARSDWAYNELKALMTYAQKTGKEVHTIPGSIYGAIGICQFMPSNIPSFGASTSSQRSVPDVFVLSDAAASVARYLSAHGWKKAKTPVGQIAVLRSYNHSDVYASTVYGVAMALVSPTSSTGALNARHGGNAVKAARDNARGVLPNKKFNKNVKPLELGDYAKILE